MELNNGKNAKKKLAVIVSEKQASLEGEIDLFKRSFKLYHFKHKNI